MEEQDNGVECNARQQSVIDACDCFIKAHNDYIYHRYCVHYRLFSKPNHAESKRDVYWFREGGVYRWFPGLGRKKPDDCHRLYVGDWSSLMDRGEEELNSNIYDEALEVINNSALEKYLNTTDYYNRIVQAIKGKKHTKVYIPEGVTLHPKLASEDKPEAREQRELQLAIIRIIAGCLVVYFNPERFGVVGLRENAVTQIKPNGKTRKTAEAMLGALEEQGLLVEPVVGNALKSLSDGRMPSQLLKIESQPNLSRKALVREACLLSKHLLVIDNGHSNRLSVKAIQNILSLAGGDAANISEKTIANYQRDHDADDPNESPLTHHTAELIDLVGHMLKEGIFKGVAAEEMPPVPSRLALRSNPMDIINF